MRTQSRSGNRHPFPVETLLRVLVPYTAWRCSTSGVEQNFSLRDLQTPKRRNHSPQTELDLLTITAYTHDDLEQVLKEAQGAWRVLYGNPRSSNAPRLRGWKRRVVAQTTQGREEWMKR